MHCTHFRSYNAIDCQDKGRYGCEVERRRSTAVRCFLIHFHKIFLLGLYIFPLKRCESDAPRRRDVPLRAHHGLPRKFPLLLCMCANRLGALPAHSTLCFLAALEQASQSPLVAHIETRDAAPVLLLLLLCVLSSIQQSERERERKKKSFLVLVLLLLLPQEG